MRPGASSRRSGADGGTGRGFAGRLTLRRTNPPSPAHGSRSIHAVARGARLPRVTPRRLPPGAAVRSGAPWLPAGRLPYRVQPAPSLLLPGIGWEPDL